MCSICALFLFYFLCFHPVVRPEGHLFCWPLAQTLHFIVYSRVGISLKAHVNHAAVLKLRIPTACWTPLSVMWWSVTHGVKRYFCMEILRVLQFLIIWIWSQSLTHMLYFLHLHFGNAVLMMPLLKTKIQNKYFFTYPCRILYLVMQIYWFYLLRFETSFSEIFRDLKKSSTVDSIFRTLSRVTGTLSLEIDVAVKSF